MSGTSSPDCRPVSRGPLSVPAGTFLSRDGLTHLYYGPGKGKTTAAVGLAIRAIGHGLSVAVLQFMKGDEETGQQYGEVSFLRSRAAADGRQFPTGHAMRPEELIVTVVSLYRRAETNSSVQPMNRPSTGGTAENSYNGPYQSFRRSPQCDAPKLTPLTAVDVGPHRLVNCPRSTRRWTPISP